MSLIIRLGTIIGLLLTFAIAGCGDQQKPMHNPQEPANSDMAPDVLYLEQGLTADDRQAFYYLTQGSQLIPYFWFLALEQAKSEALFRSEQPMQQLGYIPQKPDKDRNPDGLPIGFVKDDDPATVGVSYAMKKEFLGPNYKVENYPPDNAWLGLTCAACHAVEMTYKGQSIRIDGGPALADHESFIEQLAKALSAAHSDPRKMTRFAHRVLDPNWNQDEQDALKDSVVAYSGVLDDLVEQNRSDLRDGFGRLDAFGAILNRICAAGLEIPENQRISNAPVSFPFLWSTPQLDWVQYNASAGSPIARNLGEVLGVYTHLKLTGTPETGQFNSTAKLENLDRLEQYVAKLKAPAWPTEQFGAFDVNKVERGKKLYAQHCTGCHGVRDAYGNFPMTPENEFGKQFILTKSHPLLRIGTDPQMVQNFITRSAKPGALRKFLDNKYEGADDVPAIELLKAAVKGAIKLKLAETGLQGDALKEYANKLSGLRTPPLINPPLSNLATYKARPLNGIWATAPFLHNGSVPNLYQLLLPDNQRVKTFSVGSHEFDPENVGYRTDAGFEFKTDLRGNLNTGHSGPHFTQTKGEDGNYRDFTDDERWSLLEYMKTLN